MSAFEKNRTRRKRKRKLCFIRRTLKQSVPAKRKCAIKSAKPDARTGALLRHDRGATEGCVAARASDIGSLLPGHAPRFVRCQSIRHRPPIGTQKTRFCGVPRA